MLLGTLLPWLLYYYAILRSFYLDYWNISIRERDVRIKERS